MEENKMEENNVMNTQPELEEPISVGQWLLTTLILIIPCVNIVMMFVWAFSKTEKKSKSNYFKAMLIWMAIGIVFSIVFAGVIGAIMAAAVASLQ